MGKRDIKTQDKTASVIQSNLDLCCPFLKTLRDGTKINLSTLHVFI